MASNAHTTATATPGQRSEVTGWARAAPTAVAGLVSAGLLIWLAFSGGGYFPEQHLTQGAIALAAVAALLLVRPPRYSIPNTTLVAVGALAALAGWTALSSHWSGAPDVALEDFQRTLVYLGLFGLGLLAAGSGRYSRHVVWAMLGVILVVAGAGLLSRLRPDWISAAGTLSQYGEDRLGYPLTYWNAFGALGAMGVLLGTGLAGDPRSPLVLRSLAAAAVVPIGAAAYLSFSRGAWLAFFAGLLVLALMSAHRVSLLASMGICAAALFAAIARLGTLEELTREPPPEAVASAVGTGYGQFLVATMIVVAAAQAVVSGAWLPEHVRGGAARLARPLGVVAVCFALVAALGVYVLRAGEVEGGTAERIERAERFLDRQWDDFMATASVQGDGAERLTSAGGTRSDLWRVAIDGFEANPLLGDGAGAFEYRFAHEREVGERVRDAHGLYFETMGELGLPGLLFLLAFVGAAAWAAVSARRRRSALSGAQSAAAAAAFAVWVVHAGVDWDWQMPALTGVALVLAAALFPRGRGLRRIRDGRRRDPVADSLRRFGRAR